MNSIDTIMSHILFKICYGGQDYNLMFGIRQVEYVPYCPIHYLAISAKTKPRDVIYGRVLECGIAHSGGAL